MEIKEIDPKKLKGDEGEQTLWFRAEMGDLFIIFSPTRILHFEVTMDEKHLEGGFEKTLRYGLIDPEEHEKDALEFKRSRMVRFENEIPKGFIDQAIEIVFASSELEAAMKEGIMTFLSSKGGDDRGLQLSGGTYKSFREIVPVPFDFRQFFVRWWKKVLGIFLLLGIGFFIYQSVYTDKLEKACRKGSTVACANLGLINAFKGKNNPNRVWVESVNQGRDLLRKECDQGSMDSCYQYYDELIALRQKEISSLKKIHPMACKKGHPRGCYALAKEEYFKGETKKSITLFEKACHKNYKDSCEIVLAEKVYRFNLEKCENSDREACFEAALREIEEGDSKTAETRLEKACSEGHSPSCTRLADFLAQDKQVGRAQSLYLKACQMNDMKSCYNYRFMTSRTKEERANLTKLFQNCEKGIENSCLLLKR